MTSLFSPEIRAAIVAATSADEELERYWRRAFACLHNDRESTAVKDIYDGQPYLFMAAYPGLDIAAVQPLARAGRTIAWSIFLYDPVLDEGGQWAELALRGQALQFEAYRQLAAVFPPTSSFWDRFRDYLRDYLAACNVEQRFKRGERELHAIDEAEALSMSIGKNGMAKAAVAGLAALAGDDGPYAALIESIDQFYIAHQIIDDLADWKTDLRDRIPTLVLARVVADLGAELTALDERAVSRSLFLRGQADVLLARALAALDRAEALIAGIPCQLWRALLVGLRGKCAALRAEVAAMLSRQRERGSAPAIVLPDAPDDPRCAPLAWQATRHLIAQSRGGFGEAIHTGLFPMDAGYAPASEYLSGDAMIRAVLIDVLHEIAEASGVDLRPIIDFECDALLAAHDPDAGGWSYFNTLPELPPGADVLGHALNALIRSGRGAAAAARCAPALAHVDANGAVTTWLLPAAPATERETQQAAWVRDCWGAGPDAEAVASLARALHNLDPVRFAGAIEAAADWIEAAQAPDGSWCSRLYHAPFLTTWQCVRFLAEVRTTSPARGRARDFLVRAQLADGGWTMDDDADAMMTAHAVLGLCAASSPEEAAATVVRGVRRLGELVATAFPASMFVKLAVGRARGPVTHVLSHHSHSLTAAFVAAAAIAASRWSAPRITNASRSAATTSLALEMP